MPSPRIHLPRGGARRRRTDELLIPRRKLLKGGLASFAAALVAPLAPGCDSPPPDPDAGGFDGGPDAFMPDAGSFAFPTRSGIPERPALVSRLADLGPLQDADALGMRLPAGFSARIVATGNEPVENSSYDWHVAPDGGATYATEDGGWIYVSNAELPVFGGVGAIRFDSDANIVDAYPILSGTDANCAGGRTPWHTWLSCEEFPRGRVWECDPWGESSFVARPALGLFKHEAVAVDPVNGHLYLSEDESDGGFYRFVPDGLNASGQLNLEAGQLEIAVIDDGGAVTWAPVPDPRFENEVATRDQVTESAAFRGGEGIWFHADVIYMSTKSDNRIWAYDIGDASIATIYDDDDHGATPPLTGVDNITVSCCGDVLVAEDGGSMQIVAILPDGTPVPIMQLEGQDGSEVTGPDFDPSGTRLYFSSQRANSGTGVTYEVTGPFHEPAT